MLLYLIFIIVGALLLAGAFFSLKNRLSFLRSAERSTGRLVRYAEIEDDGSTLYYPVFEFATSERTVVTYKHSTASSSRPWKPGDTMIFIFERGKPETARMLRFWSVFWWPVCLIIPGINLLLIGAGYFLTKYYFSF